MNKFVLQNKGSIQGVEIELEAKSRRQEDQWRQLCSNSRVRSQCNGEKQAVLENIRSRNSRGRNGRAW